VSQDGRAGAAGLQPHAGSGKAEQLEAKGDQAEGAVDTARSIERLSVESVSMNRR
jgi:hypothetical protein